MNKLNYIYPSIFCEHNDFLGMLVCRTVLRKKHTDGKYYLQEFYRKSIYDNKNKLEVIKQTLNIIHSEVYNNLICGIIDPNLKTAEFEKHIFELDNNQQEESERVKEYLRY